ncbi:multiheme c-type cytochrome [Ferrimonas balearica]|uniref:multiheme c-type cytochrome n=1 Tax=Ferrimonas balearica TaxID=44012 RepID=UPI001C999339|nr:hypothetical protein [Ferrimonas balearica]MBY5993578.1 hypothetical protein [Ferrimonas balearica]
MGKITRFSALAAACLLGLAGCDGKDGRDGADGEDGAPGAPWEPPVITTSASAQVLDWHFGDGYVQAQVEVLNQDGVGVDNMAQIEVVATVVDSDGQLHTTLRETYKATDEQPIGELEYQGEGVYTITMPFEAATATASGNGYVRPGNINFPRTKRVMLPLDAAVATTDDAKCVACHGDFTAASGNSTWGWHQHHHALDNDGEVVIVEACMTCHTHTEAQDGGYAMNTMAMIGHGKMADGEGGKVSKGHAALWGNYSMDMKRCSTCHMDDVVFSATINGCVTCHSNLMDPDRDGHNHSSYTNADCAACHDEGNFKYYEHQNGAARDEALNRYDVELLSIVRSADKSTVEVTVSAIDADGNTVDLANLAPVEGETSADTPRGWATVMKHGEAFLPGRDAGHVARSQAIVDNGDGSFTYLVTHVAAYEEDEVLVGGIDGRIYYGGGSRAPITVSNIHEVRRTGADGAKCLSCHTEGLDGHGSQRGGELGGDACTQCHSAYNWEHSKAGLDRVQAWGPFMHSIHTGSYYEDRDVTMPTTDRNKKVECVACHTGEINLENVAPAVVLSGLTEDSVYGITPISATCASCHTSVQAKAHMSHQGGDFNVPVAPAGMHSGESGDFALFDPAPAVEACAVCHKPDRIAEAHQYVY